MKSHRTRSHRKLYGMVNSSYKSLIADIGCRRSRLIRGRDVYVCPESACVCAVMHMCCVSCPYMHVCLPICDHLSCVCVWAPCQAAGATFSFSLRSRRSLEQRSLILSSGACGLEACCCLLACLPLCSCRPASIKVLLLSCFIPP